MNEELLSIVNASIGNHCSHSGDWDREVLGGCADCYQISCEVADAILEKGLLRAA